MVDIEDLFAFMLTRYGSAWVRRFGVADRELVKADWSHQLQGVSRAAIEYGLNHLPDEHPPTCTAFAALCRAAPRPKVLPERVVELPLLPGVTPPPPLTSDEKHAMVRRAKRAIGLWKAQGRRHETTTATDDESTDP